MSDECDADIDGGCGACEKCDPEFWLQKSKERIAELEAENARLMGALREGLRYLKEAKRLFRPNTTNSDVDFYIAKHDKALGGEG